MSASNAQAMHGSETMSERDAEKPAREPSMEDILASIRQIIAGDQQLPLSSRSSILPPLVRPATAPPAMFPLRATLQANAARAQAPASETLRAVVVAPEPEAQLADIGTDVSDAELDEAPRQAGGPFLFAHTEGAVRAAEEPAPSRRIEREPIVRVEPPRDAAPAHDLAETAADPLISAAASASVTSSFNALATTMLMQNMPSIEDIARDMLRPILKAWLDDNLPVLVERLVRAEIERVARGR